MSDETTVFENIQEACDRLGSQCLFGIPLESADPRLLDVREADLNDHVAMQPGAMAYYGALKKYAARRLAALKREQERWEKKAFAVAKEALLAGGGKYTVDDVKAKVVMDNEAVICEYERRLDMLQQEADNIDVWWEAWRQKSYSIREHADLISEEHFHNRTYLKRPEPRDDSADSGPMPRHSQVDDDDVVRVPVKKTGVKGISRIRQMMRDNRQSRD